MSEDYPIIKKRNTKPFPLEGDRRSQTFVNNPDIDENKRRYRNSDPLRDGWDPGEDPTKSRKPRPESDIPVR